VGTKSEKRRVLRVSVHHERICERRQVQQTESFRQEMRVRAQVEGTISEGVRFFGLRRAKYKGEDGHQMQFYLTGAAMNVKRLITAMTQGRAIRTRQARVCTA
jgi:transposase